MVYDAVPASGVPLLHKNLTTLDLAAHTFSSGSYEFGSCWGFNSCPTGVHVGAANFPLTLRPPSISLTPQIVRCCSTWLTTAPAVQPGSAGVAVSTNRKR